MRSLLLLVVMISTPSYGTSCAETFEEYFGVCKNSSCTLFLTVGQVKSFGVCGRRSKIVQPSEDVKGFIESVFDNRSQSVQRLTIPYSYYGHDSPATLPQIKESVAMASLGNASEREEDITPEQIRVYAIGNEKKFWEIKLETVSVDLSDSNVNEIVNSKKSLELVQYARNIASYTVLTAVWIVLLSVSVFSINRFYKEFYCAKRIDKVAISMQLVLGATLLLAARILHEPFGLVVVLIPGLVLVMASELVLVLLGKVKARNISNAKI